MTTYLQDHPVCSVPGCGRWAQDGPRCCMHQEEAKILATEIPDYIGIARTLESSPKALNRFTNDILATKVDKLNADLQTPQPVSEDDHNRKVQRRLAEAEEQDQERFEDIA